MSDAITQGKHAAMLLRDETLMLAFRRAEEQAIVDWKDSDDPQERERAWHRVRALADVQQELHAIMAGGQYAEELLKRQK